MAAVTRPAAAPGELREPAPAGAVRVSLAPGSEPASLPVPNPTPTSAPGSASEAASHAIVVAPAQGSEAPPRTRVLVDGQLIDVEVRWLDPEHLVLGVGDGDGPHDRVLLLPPTAAARGGPARREVVVAGWRFEIEVEPASRAALRERATRARDAASHSGPTEVRAIIPGVVVSVAVAVGDQVVVGQQLLAIEAMKMQNELRAPRDGTIERVSVGPGRTIDVGDVLLVIGDVARGDG
jgi:biotin carboxyl carrier protein